MSDLGDTLIPKPGEIVVITDAYYDDGQPQPSVKIGNGIKGLSSLSYLADNADISVLENIINEHINDGTIHHQHSVNAQTHTYIVTSVPTPSLNNN